MGFDAIWALEVAAVVAGLFLWKHFPVSAFVLLSAVILFFAFFHMPLEKVERFARARVRRGECVACGTKIVGPPTQHCPNCSA